MLTVCLFIFLTCLLLFLFSEGTVQLNPNGVAIGFNLPQGGQATLTVFDIAGKEVKRIEGNYGKAHNEIKLKASDISAEGLLNYTLKIGNVNLTKSMIILD